MRSILFTGPSWRWRRFLPWQTQRIQAIRRLARVRLDLVVWTPLEQARELGRGAVVGMVPHEGIPREAFQGERREAAVRVFSEGLVAVF